MDNIDFLKRELINTLASFGNKQALIAAEHLLEHRNPAIRKEQIGFMVEFKLKFGGDPFPVVRDGLQDPAILVREAALAVAEKYEDNRYIPLAAEFLRSGSGQESASGADNQESRKNGERRTRAARYIRSCQCQDQSLMAPVIAMIADARLHTPCRLEAMASLWYPHQLGSAQAALLEALSSADGAIRIHAARGLGWLKDRHYVARTLMERLVEQGDRNALVAHYMALAPLGVAEAVPVFMKALKHEDPQIQELAVSGLRHADATRSRDVLLKLWESLPDPMAQESRGRMAAPARSRRPPRASEPGPSAETPVVAERPRSQSPSRNARPARPVPGRPRPDARPRQIGGGGPPRGSDGRPGQPRGEETPPRPRPGPTTGKGKPGPRSSSTGPQPRTGGAGPPSGRPGPAGNRRPPGKGRPGPGGGRPRRPPSSP